MDEQCLVFSRSGDLAAGVVLAGINSSHQQAPDDDPHNTCIVYPDGAKIDYNHQSHAFNVTLPDGGSAVIEAPAAVTVRFAAVTPDAPPTTCTRNLLVQKAPTYMGGMSGQGSGAVAAAWLIVKVTHSLSTQGLTTQLEMGSKNNEKES
ncbi:phage baseplate assembly protein V [Undibacterium sp. Dicai25W]|uniref:phage baseplate assembly protein V n=1 Tax=Undibacterium sp. Dicai25W TaxID=3413034 RepID=UPI003BEF8D1A